MLRLQMLLEGTVRVQSATVVVFAKATVVVAVTEMREARFNFDAVMTTNVTKQIFQGSACMITAGFASKAHCCVDANIEWR